METPRSSTLIILLAVTALISASFGALGGYLTDQYFSLTSNLVPGADHVDENIVRMIEEESSTISVVDRVTPAVVSIVIKQKLKDLSPSMRFNYEDFFSRSGKINSEDTDQLIEVGSGTGFFVTTDGYVVTNRHVAENADYVFFVITNDDQELPAEFIDADPFFDIALLKVVGENFPVVNFGDSNQVQVGQTVIAIGNALSQYQNTVTKGIVSGINRRISASDYFNSGEIIEGAIQTDAAINPGNSGGPLINLFGEVIGMNTAINSQGEGLGFAISINEVKQAVESVQKNGKIIRPWLGVQFIMLDKDYASEHNLTVTSGALLVGNNSAATVIVPESPAAKAGLKEGDIIVSVDGEKLDEENSLSRVVREHLSGEVLSFSVLRDGQLTDFFITLEEYKE